ncbi:MAG: hypothetical protein PHD81_02550 [Candidatus Nanoarchaeia archaeon]|nr:hypothetical protein [Candidatus Nanoarchaeia archaeon]MDD5587966.1 hypothetical protein [Candidatus Nanoarchaeia archaeon]
MVKKRLIAKDIPFAEITLRKYEKPGKLPKRELIRKLCLSSGLLQPGDSRDIIVDILFVLTNSKTAITSEEIKSMVIQTRKKNKLQLKGIASSNIRRQLKRLKTMFLVEKYNEGYRITEDEKLITLFEEKIEKYYLNSIISRVKEYYGAIK